MFGVLFCEGEPNIRAIRIMGSRRKGGKHEIKTERSDDSAGRTPGTIGVQRGSSARSAN